MASAAYDSCPSWAPAFGYAGAASCIILSNWGSAYGTWKAGLGVCQMGIDYPKGIVKNIVPIVMAGVLGIYGLIVAVIIAQSITPPSSSMYTTYSQYNGWCHLAAGLCCGLSGLAAGLCIGIIGDAGVTGFGLRAAQGRKWWYSVAAASDGDGEGGGGDVGDAAARELSSVEDSNKLFVGLLIMLIFSEALALYGLIVALILSQHTFYCE